MAAINMAPARNLAPLDAPSAKARYRQNPVHAHTAQLSFLGLERSQYGLGIHLDNCREQLSDQIEEQEKGQGDSYSPVAVEVMKLARSKVDFWRDDLLRQHHETFTAQWGLLDAASPGGFDTEAHIEHMRRARSIMSTFSAETKSLRQEIIDAKEHFTGPKVLRSTYTSLVDNLKNWGDNFDGLLSTSRIRTIERGLRARKRLEKTRWEEEVLLTMEALAGQLRATRDIPLRPH